VGRVGGELRTVKRGWRKLAQNFRERLRSDGPDFGRSARGKTLGQYGSARNRSRTPAAKEARFRYTAVHDSCGELEDVAADGIAYLHCCTGAGQLPGIAWIAKVIENGFAEHFRKYPKGSVTTATRYRLRQRNAETQSSQTRGNIQECSSRKKSTSSGANTFSPQRQQRRSSGQPSR